MVFLSAFMISLIRIFIYNNTLELIYTGLSVIMYGFYIIFDT
jgi:hypothetical protein